MRAIVKPWGIDIQTVMGELLHHWKIFRDENGFVYSEYEIINEDEWDAEIYALLLIASGVIYE